MTVIATSSGSGTSVMGTGINTDGTAVLGNVFTDDHLNGRLFTPGGTASMYAPTGYLRLGTSAMSPDARWVVGDLLGAGGHYEAFVYSQGLGVVVLRDWLATEWGLDMTGIELLDARAISADGRTIVGTGTPRNWLVRLPAERPGDFNGDNQVDFLDLNEFIDCFEGRSVLPASTADLNHDSFVDFFDVEYFLENF